MEKITKYAVVCILQHSILEDGHFTYWDYFQNPDRGYKRWANSEKAIEVAKQIYDKEKHIEGQYHNWAVLEQIYAPRKRVADKLLKQKIIFCANPNFIFA